MTVSNGFYVAVTNNSMRPIIKNEGVEVSPGTVSNIAIERSFYYQMASPYGDCREDTDTLTSSDSDLYVKTVAITKYSRKLCYQVCFQYRYVIPTCNCSDPSIESNENNITSCSHNYGASCISGLEKSFDSSTCSTDCPEVCERVKYSYKVTESSFPTE